MIEQTGQLKQQLITVVFDKKKIASPCMSVVPNIH